MSRQDHLKKLISIHHRRLQILETTRLTMGPDTPESILIELDDIKTKITSLQEEVEEFEQGTAKIPPPQIQGSYYSTKETFSELRQILSELSAEINHISPKAKGKTTHLLDGAKQRFLELEEEWRDLNLQSETAEAALKALQSKLAMIKSTLNVLILRRIHRRRYSLLQEKLTYQQSILSQEQLQTTLQPQLLQIREQIQSLEDKAQLTPQEEKQLTVSRRKLELSEQILIGQRPYASLSLWNEVIELEQTLEEFDNRIIEL